MKPIFLLLLILYENVQSETLDSYGDEYEEDNEVVCHLPPKLRGNDEVHIQTFFPDGYLSFSCPKGYKLKGASKITCLADGRWSARVPTCQPTGANPFPTEDLISITNSKSYCMNPKIPTFGSRKPLKPRSRYGFKPGAKLTYTCDDGYELSGSAQITCLDNGKWTKRAPNCTESDLESCQEPEVPINGEIIGDKNGETIEFKCNSGYNLVGEKMLHCMDDGTWSDEPPTCEQHDYCENLDLEFGETEIVNPGYYKESITKYSNGEVVNVNCFEGTRLIGNAQIKCKGNNEWWPKTPQCLIVEDMEISCKTMGTQIDFSSVKLLNLFCPPECVDESAYPIWGYKFYSQSSHICVAAIHAGYLKEDGGHVTITSNSTCNNFESITSRGVHSLSLNQTSPCFQFYKPCPMPPELENGYYSPYNATLEEITSGTNFIINAQIIYHCKTRNYELIGNNIKTCQPDGTWNSEPLTCIDKSNKECEDPGIPEFSTRVPEKLLEKFNPDDKISFSCPNGTKMIGPSQITCLKSGSWSAQVPFCKIYADWEISCHTIGDQIELPDGKYLQLTCPGNCSETSIKYQIWGSDFYRENSHICWAASHAGMLSADNRIVLIINNGIKKTFTGSLKNGISSLWHNGVANSFKFSKLTSCPSPPHIKNTQVIEVGNIIHTADGRYPFHSKIKYKCTSYYHQATGSIEKTCLENGTWTGEQILCKPYCGISNTVSTGTIAGGSDTLVGEWPWHVGLGYELEDEEFPNSIICGGSLINENWLATAAHCVTERQSLFLLNLEEIMYTFGQFFYNINKNVQVQKRYANKVILHNSYHPLALHYDIALVELKEPVTLDKHVQPVCLPDDTEQTGRLTTNALGTVMGWGYTDEKKETTPTNLLAINVTVLPEDQCKEFYKVSYQWEKEILFCAGNTRKQGVPVAETCKGDSGGGLVYRNLRGIAEFYSLQGIVSHGTQDGCGVANRYPVFTNVTAVLAWIKEHVKDL